MDDEILNKMFIAIFTPTRIALMGAGDWIQAYNTATALRQLGHDVVHILYGDKVDYEGYAENVVHIDECALPINADVWHFIPTAPETIHIIRSIESHRPKPLLVASTIFWDSLTHRRVCAINEVNHFNIPKFCAKRLYPRISKSWKRYSCYDLLLPNSHAEIAVLKKNFLIHSNTIIASIPNAINEIPEWALSCQPPNRVGPYEYIVYPGVFSPRKNQLGFIRAMRDSKYLVVFMGGALPGDSCGRYYERCKAEAPAEWIFLGKVEHQSPEFYGVLRNARVACLTSSCETPGIAMLEAASLGARPVITSEGCAVEYLGFNAEYANPLSPSEIREAVDRAWARGKLLQEEMKCLRRYTWENTAKITTKIYRYTISKIMSSDM